MKLARAVSFCLLVAVLFLPLCLRAAQEMKEAPPAPIPAQILTARKVFIGNAGGEDSTWFTGGTDRTYNQFYAAVKSLGRYELVGSPGDADLLLEIRFALIASDRPVINGSSVGSALFDPQFQLVIREPKTHALLWGFTEHVTWALLKGNRDKNSDEALSKLVDSLQKLAVLPASALGAK